MLNICFYGRRNFKGCHISIKVNLFDTLSPSFTFHSLLYFPVALLDLEIIFANFKSLLYFSQKWTIEFFFNICFSVCLFSWNLLCDCSFDILTFSRDSLRLSVLMVTVCWFDVTIKLMVDMDNLTTLMHCFDFVIRCEVGGWWLRILVSCFNMGMFIIWFRVRCLQFTFPGPLQPISFAFLK